MRNFKNKRKVLLASVLLFFHLIAVHASVFAALEDDKANYDTKAEQKKKQSRELQNKIDSISEEKRALDEEADAAIEKHLETKKILEETEGRIAENESKLEKIQEEYKKKLTVLGKRVRDIYINGQISYLDVLFGAKDFNDFMTRMDLLKKIIQQDYALVVAVQEQQQTIEKAQKELEKDRAAQAQQESEAHQTRRQMEEKVRQRERLIGKMMLDKAYIDQQYDEFVAASKQITQMILNSKYQVAASAGGSGAMRWPLGGTITSPFGWRTHPITGDQRFHSGIDIANDYGAPICAAQSGVVTYAGWISGYGNSVMINHGGGIVTLYGHCQSVAASVGQHVSQGQVIAYCGSTGNSTGPHCHFEVRQNGNPVDPMAYL